MGARMNPRCQFAVVLVGFLLTLTGGTTVAVPPEDAPCNASQLVLEARRFIESNRPARVALDRLLHAQNDCPDESVAFELNLYLAVALMHEGRIPEAKLAATRAQANAWDDEQSARAGVVQIALSDLVGEVVLTLPGPGAGASLRLRPADPESLPPETVLDDALPREKAFARATLAAMISAAEAHIREADIRLVTVYLPLGTYRLSNGQVFRVGTGTTNLKVNMTWRFPVTGSLAVGTFTHIVPLDKDTLSIAHAGAIGFGLEYAFSPSDRLLLVTRIQCAPFEVPLSEPTAGSTPEGGVTQENGALVSGDLDTTARMFASSSGFKAWNAALGANLGWPVPLGGDKMWVVPRVGATLLWMEGVVAAVDLAQAGTLETSVPPKAGVTAEWAGVTVALELAFYWTLSFPPQHPIGLQIVVGAGLGTGVIRPVTADPAVDGTPFLDVSRNAVGTGGTSLALAYQF